MEFKALRGLLSLSFHMGRTDSNGGSHAAPPERLEVTRVQRLQNWPAWFQFVSKRESIREQLFKQVLDEDERQREREAGEKGPCAGDGSGRPGRWVCDVPVPEPLKGLLGPEDAATNTVWMFHGITVAKAESMSTNIFDIEHSGVSEGRLYGRGIYLSESSQVIDSHSVENSSSELRCMLACRVTLGNVLSDESLLPEITSLVAQCTEGQYHSVLGNRSRYFPGSCRDFVVYDRDQVYPEYLIFYRRVYAAPFAVNGESHLGQHVPQLRPAASPAAQPHAGQRPSGSSPGGARRDASRVHQEAGHGRASNSNASRPRVH